MSRAGRLDGKVCLISGTGGSMGRAAALAFAAEGALVVGCDRALESATETVSMVNDAGSNMISLPQACDLTDPEQCRQFVDLAMDHHGRIDVLFNNAAMGYFEPFADMSRKTWRDTIEQELDIVFTLTRACWPHLSRNGGSVVTTASGCGWIATPALGAAAHSAAKGGIIAMTRQLAAEGAPLGIRVNSVSPGLIVTKQTEALIEDPEWREAMIGKHLLKRAGRPEEVANVVLFLASDESSFVTGADIRVDGGASAW